MKFNTDKLKQLARPMNESELKEIESRNENREWSAMSAKFALVVRRILRAEKMTQTELAARMGVSCVQITKILSGKENLSLKTIAKVEKALGRNLVAFGEDTDVSVFIPSRHVFTQVISIPMVASESENHDVKGLNPAVFSISSVNKILV